MWDGPSTAKQVRVPDIVGLPVGIARSAAWEAGVVLAAADPDGPPLGALTWPGSWVVTAQRPAPGTILHWRGSVAVEFEPVADGLAGDREPRRPIPPLGSLHAEVDQGTDEVGAELPE